MERGEVVVLVVQFGVLLLAILVIANVLPSQTAITAPTFGSVYWGPQQNGTSIQPGQTLKTSTNASSIYAYFRIAPSATLTSVDASRFCLNSSTKDGQSKHFETIGIGYDSGRGESYLILTPTGQQAGLACTYDIQVTDSLSQSARWTGTVQLR